MRGVEGASMGKKMIKVMSVMLDENVSRMDAGATDEADSGDGTSEQADESGEAELDEAPKGTGSTMAARLEDDPADVVTSDVEDDVEGDRETAGGTEAGATLT